MSLKRPRSVTEAGRGVGGRGNETNFDIGRDRAAVPPAGKQTISLTFSFPYAGEKMARYWTTSKRDFSAAGGQIVRFELCEDARTEPSDPKWTETGWHTMWLLRDASANSAAQRCASEPNP
jgi:hypothetical protein